MSENGPEFFQTVMGRAFYERDVPAIVTALAQISGLLDVMNVANSSRLVQVEIELAETRVQQTVQAAINLQDCERADSMERELATSLEANAALRRQVERLLAVAKSDRKEVSGLRSDLRSKAGN